MGEYGDAMYRYAFSRLRDGTSAEDAVQESLLAALYSRDKFRGDAAERTWLFGILKHKILDQHRRNAREVQLSSGDETDTLIERFFDSTGSWRLRPDAWQNPERNLERHAFWMMIEHCIDSLPKTLAVTVKFVEIDELDTEEACKALGISTTNLWVRLHRARLRLRECIDRSWFSSRDVRGKTR